jgi:DNA repair photolyase
MPWLGRHRMGSKLEAMKLSDYWPGDLRNETVLRDHTRPVLEPCPLSGHQYQLDPYMGCGHQCCYCYALVRKDDSWLKGVKWYDNLARRLAAELSNLEPQTIYMGWNSDPYQPIEAKTQLTREALSLLARHRFSASILTKSDLVTRDIDLLATMSESSAGVSVSFIDEEVRSFFEPNTCQTACRVAALEKLRGSGIRTYALVCPVIPFVTDTEAVIRAVTPYADSVWVYGLRIRREQDPNWQKVLAVLRTHFPTLTGQITDAVFHTEHPFWAGLRTGLARLAAETRLDLRLEF